MVRISVHPPGNDDQIDELDADERGDHTPDAVDQKVPAQDRGGAHGPELDAPQRDGNQQHDDDRIEYDRAEDGGVRIVELHDVEGLQLREHPPGTWPG